MQSRLNRRGQIGETTTWIVATLIIVVVLLIFIYASSALSKLKIVSYKEPDEKDVDWVNEKTSFALERNNQDSNKINSWINEENV